jgi:hypothetical protein
MIRELVLVGADLKATRWFPAGAPPRVELPAGLILCVVEKDASLFTGEPIPTDVAAARLEDGDRCVAVREGSGKIVGQLWLSKHPRHLDWIGCTVAPREGTALLYNAWVDPAHRGRGVHWAMASQACAEAVALGFSKISAGVDRHEYQPFAQKYAEMGLAVITPYAALWCLRAVGWHATLKPPRLLVELSKDLVCADAAP